MCWQRPFSSTPQKKIWIGFKIYTSDILIQICKKSLLHHWQGLPNHWTLKLRSPGRRLCIALNLPNGLSRNFFRLRWSLNPKNKNKKESKSKNPLFTPLTPSGKGKPHLETMGLKRWESLQMMKKRNGQIAPWFQSLSVQRATAVRPAKAWILRC